MTYPEVTNLQSAERDIMIQLTNTGKFPSKDVSKVRSMLKAAKATKADISLVFQSREFIAKILSYYE